MKPLSITALILSLISLSWSAYNWVPRYRVEQKIGICEIAYVKDHGHSTLTYKKNGCLHDVRQKEKCDELFYSPSSIIRACTWEEKVRVN